MSTSRTSRGTSGRGGDGRVEFEDLGEGRFALSGELSFDTATAALERGRALFSDQKNILLDLAGVTRTDSAGLALLLEWVNWARNNERGIAFSNIPAQIMCIAQISEMEHMLG